MASQESEESVDEDDVCAHRIGVLMAPVKREDVRANVVRSRIGDRSIDLRVVAGHSVLVRVVLAFLPLALLCVLMKSSPANARSAATYVGMLPISILPIQR